MIILILLELMYVTNPMLLTEKDSQFVNTYGHDETGRFIPYWNRLHGETVLEPLLDYDTLDYYQVPKNTKNTVLTEPYYYEGVFIVSFASPILKNDEFVGIGGVDISLTYIDEIVNQVKAFDTGYAFMTGRTGILISHPTNKDWIGSKTLYDFNVPEIDDMAEENPQWKQWRYIKTVDPITNKESVMFYEPVRTSNFSFILVVPEDEMLAGGFCSQREAYIYFPGFPNFYGCRVQHLLAVQSPTPSMKLLKISNTYLTPQ